MSRPKLPSEYDAAAPNAFYLGDPSGEFASLADATLVAEGHELLVHSQVLSQHSGVLRSLFAAHGTRAMEAGRNQLPEVSLHGAVYLQEPFQDYTAHEVSAFLRLLYWPELADGAAFKALGESVHGVVRLAHQLDALCLLCKLDGHLSETVSSSTLDQAVGWAQLAERCGLERLRVRCIRQLAHSLATSGTAGGIGGTTVRQYHELQPVQLLTHPGYQPSTPGRTARQPTADALADISKLQCLSQDALLAVLASCVVAVRRGRCDGYLPTAADLESAMLP